MHTFNKGDFQTGDIVIHRNSSSSVVITDTALGTILVCLDNKYTTENKESVNYSSKSGSGKITILQYIDLNLDNYTDKLLYKGNNSSFWDIMEVYTYKNNCINTYTKEFIRNRVYCRA